LAVAAFEWMHGEKRMVPFISFVMVNIDSSIRCIHLAFSFLIA
jgi:hypothetical protein